MSDAKVTSIWEERYKDMILAYSLMMDDRDRLGSKLEKALRIMSREQCVKLAVGDSLVRYRSAKDMQKACVEFAYKYPSRKRTPKKLTK